MNDNTFSKATLNIVNIIKKGRYKMIYKLFADVNCYININLPFVNLPMNFKVAIGFQGALA